MEDQREKDLKDLVIQVPLLAGHLFDAVVLVKDCYNQFSAAEKHVRIRDDLAFHRELISNMYNKVNALEEHVKWLVERWTSTLGDSEK